MTIAVGRVEAGAEGRERRRRGRADAGPASRGSAGRAAGRAKARAPGPARTPGRRACRRPRRSPGRRRAFPWPGRRRRGVGRRTQVGDHRHGRASSPPFSARTWKLVRSWPVAALMWPPSASIDLDDLARRALAGALEHHVLEQVRPAGLLRRLVPRAAADDHARAPGSPAPASGRRRRGRRWPGVWMAGAGDRLRPRRSRGRRPSPPRASAGSRSMRSGFLASACTERGRRGADAGGACAPRPGTWPDGRSTAPPAASCAAWARSAPAAATADGRVRVDQLAGLVEGRDDGARWSRPR